MPLLSERDLRIQSRYNQLKDQIEHNAEIHRIIGKEFELSASRVRHILSDLKKVPTEIPVPITSEFPDKKKPTRSYIDIVDQIRSVQKYKKLTSVSQDEATWNPNPQYPNLPIALCWMPDIHFGSLDTDYDFLERHLDVITTTPNMFVAFGGDLSDNYNVVKHPTGIWGDGVTPEDQFAGLADKLTELDDAKKISAITWGNHDEFSAMAGINPFSVFIRNVSCPLFWDGGGVLTINIGNQSYRGGMRHTHWGVSKLNPTNSPKRMLQFWRGDLDFACVGHVHTAAGEDFTFAGQQRIAVVGGTYKLLDGFSKRWIGDAQPAGYTILLYPDRKHMQLCRYPEDAQDIIMGKIARLATFAAR